MTFLETVQSEILVKDRAARKVSLVLADFNGFAKTIKNQWKSDMF